MQYAYLPFIEPCQQYSVHTSLSLRDEEMDGEWEAPQVPNPACTAALGCGEWKPPMVNNPQYKGKWRAPLIDNPNYQVLTSGVWKCNVAEAPRLYSVQANVTHDLS